ncbi:type II toxin-antitoxin system HicB family antitoxin [Carnimonas bestiolae]|uniref:type II toxin-antitoxin system HicB family antitoxin n=1 Tax=Carnimonas bestiolae TaxID=3402172 RepID=UPI003EDC21DF
MFEYAIKLHDDGTWADCRDIPEFATAGDDRDDTLANAADGLVSALSIYQDQGRAFPKSSLPRRGEAVIYLPAVVLAKAALWDEMVAQGLKKADLARIVGVSPTIAGRLVDVLYNSKIEQVEKALAALGKRITLSVVAA